MRLVLSCVLVVVLGGASGCGGSSQTAAPEGSAPTQSASDSVSLQSPQVGVRDIEDPGPGTVYRSCGRAIGAINQARSASLTLAEGGRLSEAGTEAWRMMRLIVANPLCVEEARVQGAEKALKSQNLNKPSTIAEDVPVRCRQALVDAVRLLQMAGGFKAGGQDHSRLIHGFDGISRLSPGCLTPEELATFRRLFAEL